MNQINIKNETACHLLNKLTQLTGESKTQTIIKALELYEAQFTQKPEVARVIADISANIHPYLRPEVRGRMPGKDQIEHELGMP
jgi:hypothetical protein